MFGFWFELIIRVKLTHVFLIRPWFVCLRQPVCTRSGRWQICLVRASEMGRWQNQECLPSASLLKLCMSPGSLDRSNPVHACGIFTLSHAKIVFSILLKVRSAITGTNSIYKRGREAENIYILSRLTPSEIPRMRRHRASVVIPPPRREALLAWYEFETRNGDATISVTGS